MTNITNSYYDTQKTLKAMGYVPSKILNTIWRGHIIEARLTKRLSNLNILLTYRNGMAQELILNGTTGQILSKTIWNIRQKQKKNSTLNSTYSIT